MLKNIQEKNEDPLCDFNNTINTKFSEVIEKTNMSLKEILICSPWDIRKKTNMNFEDIVLLKDTIAEYFFPCSITASNIWNDTIIQSVSVSTGSESINNFLCGGFRRGKVTEIFGKSGSGKTQLALQSLAYNWANGCAYICTEDSFPVKRLNQIIKNKPDFDASCEYGQNIFIEQVIETIDLLSSIKVRMPKLMEQKTLCLIVIDSVAAPFRCENVNYIQRAEDLRELGYHLTKLAQDYNLAVLCLNQVTDSFDDSDVLRPALGLAWSNMVSYRLWLRKTSSKRELISLSSPDLPYKKVPFLLTAKGIEDC